jgi:hypothetical protein
VHPVLLAAAGADDDDRGADALGPGGLDQLPAVEERHHQVEDADVGALETESRQPRLAVAHPQRVEPGLREMRGHAFGDQLVVLDDQDPWHRLQTLHVQGSARGRSLVNSL